MRINFTFILGLFLPHNYMQNDNINNKKFEELEKTIINKISNQLELQKIIKLLNDTNIPFQYKIEIIKSASFDNDCLEYLVADNSRIFNKIKKTNLWKDVNITNF